jgi:flavin-binding protein dodecin
LANCELLFNRQQGSPIPKVVKVIEVLAESENSWEDAAKAALAEASKTLRHIRSLYVENFVAAVDNGKITTYRINAKNFIRSGADSPRLSRSGEAAVVHGRPSTVAFAPTLIL